MRFEYTSAMIPTERSGLSADAIEGLARFDMYVNTEGYWVIKQWEDTKIAESSPDWGELRNQFK